jgi:aminoglycoside/choline kinase family phosphotransferase
LAERGAAIGAFLEAHGWGGAARTPIAGDASFRRYERLCDQGRRAVLMDAPPPNEDARPFVRMARHLRGLGYSAPAVLAEDAAAGLLVIEDLGDDTYASLLDGGAAPEPLFERAVDVLVDLHRRPAGEAVPAGLEAYDDARLLDEACLMTDWYMPAVLGRPTDGAARAAYRDAWRAALPVIHGLPRTLVLRDFFAENLMWLAGRDGIAACGLLDFQDAVAGPAAYDLVSLLEDERRDMDAELAARLTARYRAAFPELDGDAFATACAVLGAQRHAKNIGIFTRLSGRDGKPGYLVHIPRMWGLLERRLDHPALASVGAWFARHLPGAARNVPPAAAL